MLLPCKGIPLKFHRHFTVVNGPDFLYTINDIKPRAPQELLLGRGISNMKNIKKHYDVIVAGGGLSGVAAAVAAAREGTSVLLIERYGFLGGMATAGLVNPFMPYHTNKGGWQEDRSCQINTGIFNKILEDLSDLGGLLPPDNRTFNEEIMKLVLDRMLRKSGVQILMHSFISAVEKEDNRIRSVTAVSKSGTLSFQASYFIDATGDADLSALSGCEYKIGRDDDHLCQPMTLCFRLANVDRLKFEQPGVRKMVQQKYEEMKAQGVIKNPRENILVFPHMVDDVLHFNTTRIIHKSPVDVEDLTEAEIEAREQVYEMYKFLKEYAPGFENCQILMSAPQIGVRESRRIVGHYTITADDLLNTVKFEDSVARGSYPVDIHNPSGSGTVIKHIPPGDYYTIPYRALIPKGVDNLIVAGRPLSSTHEAHSAFRVMPICTCVGEGAGSAASIAIKKDIPFKDVDPKEIHQILDKYDALY